MDGRFFRLAGGACLVPSPAGESLIFVSLASGAFAGICARLRTHFSLSRQRKVSKRKATPLSATRSKASGNLSDAGLAGNRSNSATASNNRGSFFRHTRTTQAHTEGSQHGLLVARSATLQTVSSSSANHTRCNARLSRASSAACCAVMRRRVAQGWAGQGSRLFEAKPSSSETPPGPSNAAYRHTVPGDAFGSLFFWVLFFGEAKKSASPAGARPGQPAQQESIKNINLTSLAAATPGLRNQEQKG